MKASFSNLVWSRSCLILIFAVTCLLMTGVPARGRDPKVSDEVKQLQVLAEKGDARAQYELWLAYRDGKGVEQDLYKALRWLILAEKQEYERLGLMGAEDKTPSPVPSKPPDEIRQSLNKSLEEAKNAADVNEKAIYFFIVATTRSPDAKDERPLDYFEKALEAYRTIGDIPGEMITLLAMSESAADTDQALHYAEQSLEAARKVGSGKGKREAIERIVSLYKKSKAPQKALEFLKSGLDVEERNNDALGMVLYLVKLADFNYHSLKLHKQAQEYCHEAAEIARRDGRFQSLVTACDGCRFLYLPNDPRDKVRAWFANQVPLLEQALQASRKVGDIWAEMMILNRIAITLSLAGQDGKAIPAWEKARELANASKDLDKEYRFLSLLASRLRDHGEYRRALECGERKLAIARQKGWPGRESHAFRDMAKLYACVGSHALAIKAYEKSIRLYERFSATATDGFFEKPSRVLPEMAKSYVELGNYDKARELCEDSLKKDSKEKSKPEGARLWADREDAEVLETIAEAYKRQGATDKAIDYLIKAKWKLKGQAPLALAEIYLEQGRTEEAEAIAKEGRRADFALGRFYLLKGEFDAAKHYYEKSQKDLEDTGRVDSLFTIYTGLGKVYEAKADYRQAEEYYGKAVQVLERLRSNLPPGEWPGFDDVQISGFRRSEPVEGLARVRRQMGRTPQTIESREKAKAKAAEERLAEEMQPDSVASGQTKDDAEKLHEQGRSLQERARSKQDLEIAAQRYKAALKIFRRLGDVKGESKALYNLGNIYRDWRQYDKALACHKKYMDIARSVGDGKAEGEGLGLIGMDYAARGDYTSAISQLEKFLKIARKNDDTGGESVALASLGLVYKALGRPSLAIQSYEKALEIVRRLSDSTRETLILRHLGDLYLDLGQYAKAIDHYKRSLSNCRKAGDLRTEARVLGDIGTAYSVRSQYSRAVEYYEQSLNIALETQDLKAQADAIRNLGGAWKGRGWYTKAAECYDRALEMSRELRDIRGEGQSLNNLGTVYAAWWRYEKAIVYFEKSLAIMRNLGDTLMVCTCLNNLGAIHADLGQYSKALECHEESLTKARSIGDMYGQGASLNNLGCVYYDLGHYARAAEQYDEALTISRKVGNMKVEEASLNNLGNLYKQWGQHEKAAEFYKRAIELSRKMGDPAGEALSLGNLGETYAMQGKLEISRTCYKKQIEIEVAIGVPADRSKARMVHLYLDMNNAVAAEESLKGTRYREAWARFYLMKSDFKKARQTYNELLASAQNPKNANQLFAACTGLGLACEGLGEYPKSLDYFRHGVNLVEDLRSGLTPAQREHFFDVRINGFYRTTPYEGLARVLLKLNRPAESAKWAEYTKARLFAETISKRNDHAGLDAPKEVREKDSVLNDQLAALTRNLQKAYEKGSKEVIESLEPQVKDAKEKLAKHVETLRKEYPLFAATRYPQPMDLAKTALKDGEWVVEYQVTHTELLVYLIGGKTVVKAMCKPVTRQDLSDLVKKFRAPFEGITEDNLTEKLKAFDFGAGKKLADILLGDILSELPKKTPLIVVPDDCLGVIPFEMLVLNEGGKISSDGAVPNAVGAEFFGDRNPISYSQSITALTLARTLGTQASTANKLLVMADPIFEKNDPRIVQLSQQTNQDVLDKTTEQVIMSAKVQNKISWPRLPGTRRLAESLRNSFPNATDLCLGADANKRRFLDTNLTPYQSIVFATHGYGGNDLGGLKEPVLVLTLINQPPGEDGFLRMTEVMGKKMNADVVALTGCQTGLGRRISGEGTMGMGRAFQYAGAKSALMSLWNVAETTSVRLVESFFKYRKEGKSKLEALRLARDEIRKAGYDHPFFWAPFILVGEVQ